MSWEFSTDQAISPQLSYNGVTHHKEERVYKGWHPSLVQICQSALAEEFFDRGLSAMGSAEDILIQPQKTVVGSGPSFKEDLQI